MTDSTNSNNTNRFEPSNPAMTSVSSAVSHGDLAQHVDSIIAQYQNYKYKDVGIPVYPATASGATVLDYVGPRIELGEFTLIAVTGNMSACKSLQDSMRSRYHRVKKYMEENDLPVTSVISLKLIRTDWHNLYFIMVIKRSSEKITTIATYL